MSATSISLPETAHLTSRLASLLQRAGVTEVLTDSTNRAAYASDASLYRVLPRAVVRPRHNQDVAAVLEVCRELRLPVTARGAGTSVAGNAVGPGVVLDFSRHLDRVLDLDPASRTARVQAGAVHASLKKKQQQQQQSRSL